MAAPRRPPYCGISRFQNCTVDASRRLGHHEWKLVTDDPGKLCTGSFVSLLSTDSFVDAALCLHNQLRLVRSACDHVLVYDDRALTAAAIGRLSTIFPPQNLIPLAMLVSRSQAQVARARQQNLTSRGRAFAGRLTREDGTSRGTFAAEAVKKLWLWALPPERFPLACILDLDVLVTANLDALLRSAQVLPPESSHDVAAVSALGCWQGANVFNSALVVFRPSLAKLEALLRRERSFERVGQACENAFTDQSLLNAEFRGGCADYRVPRPCDTVRWQRLPLSYNVNVQMVANVPEEAWDGAEVALIHFAGRYAKPWQPLPKLENIPAARHAALRREGISRERWRRACNATPDVRPMFRRRA